MQCGCQSFDILSDIFCYNDFFPDKNANYYYPRLSESFFFYLNKLFSVGTRFDS